MWSLYLVNSLDFELSLTFVTDTALITVHFGEINHTTCALYFFLIQHYDKNLYCTDSFITLLSVWKLLANNAGGGKSRNSCSEK